MISAQSFREKIAFVTYFDSNYLFLGEALIESLKKYDIHVIVNCLDSVTFSALSDKDGVTAVNLQLDAPEIFGLHKTRDFRSWVWMLSSLIVYKTIQDFRELDVVVYCDADLLFYRNPLTLLGNFYESNKDVMVSPHHYNSGIDGYLTSGAYCVQFMAFKRTSIDIVKDWKNKCIGNSGFVPGVVFGDQYYVNEWINDFPNRVYVQDFEFSILAPWNLKTITISNAIAFHLHGIKFSRICFSRSVLFTFGTYYVPKDVRRFLISTIFPVLAEFIKKSDIKRLREIPLKMMYFSRWILMKW